jgi:hypothetical protein
MMIPGAEDGGPWPTRLVVERNGTSIRFYCVEMSSSAVMIIQPE